VQQLNSLADFLICTLAAMAALPAQGPASERLSLRCVSGWTLVLEEQGQRLMIGCFCRIRVCLKKRIKGFFCQLCLCFVLNVEKAPLDTIDLMYFTYGTYSRPRFQSPDSRVQKYANDEFVIVMYM